MICLSLPKRCALNAGTVAVFLTVTKANISQEMDGAMIPSMKQDAHAAVSECQKEAHDAKV